MSKTTLQDTIIKSSKSWDWKISEATFSRDEVYRYDLKRLWVPQAQPLIICMLNPSTADHEVLDPTVTRCINFANRLNFGGVIVLNLFALRSTLPKEMMLFKGDPVGEYNYHYWKSTLLLYRPSYVLCAWGVYGGFNNQDVVFMKLLKELRIPAKCLALTKTGFPRHPLYLPKTSYPIDYKLPNERSKL